ncbi:MAG: hypothetical protein KAG99_06030, partial [Bacteroidales bacterium]|nr:hypothetical protein [Bacteroidales bacterium]
YQAVLRDNTGFVIGDDSATIKATLLGGNYNIPVYAEEHNVVTAENGFFELSLGCGNRLFGDYASLNWANGPFYLLYEIDTSGVGDYEVMGFSQLMSVPYALYANRTGDSTYWRASDSTDLYNNMDQIGIGTATIDSSAIIEISTDSLGLLLPRMITTWRDEIEDPEAGLMIYNYDCHCINVFNGFEWVEYGKEDNIDFKCGDIFIDPRDGQRYETIEIGPQCWMTQNLAFGTMIEGDTGPSNDTIPEKYCYNDIPVNCRNYGALYQWDELMQYDTLVGNQGLCPDDWHLPESHELDTLKSYVNTQAGTGNAIKSGGSSGFDAMFAGLRDDNGQYSGKDLSGFYWTASQSSLDEANFYSINSNDTTLQTSDTSKMNAFSVRCVKGLPLRINPNVVVIDTNIYQLISDSAEIANGIFRYLIIGRDEQEIDVGDIIIQFYEDLEKSCGHINVVKSIERIGNILKLLTDLAYWEDVFETGELINKKLELFSDINSYIDPTNPNLSFLQLQDGFLCYISDLTLGPPNSLNLTITSGYIKIICNPTFTVKFNNGLDKLSLKAEPLEIKTNLNLVLSNAGGLYEKEHQYELLSFSKPLPLILIGQFPLLLEIDFDLNLISSIRLEGNFSVDKKIEFYAKYGMGVEFLNGSLKKVWDKPEIDNEPHLFVTEDDFEAELKLAMEPRITLSAYCQGGPFLNTSTYIKAIFNKNFDTDDFDMSIYRGNDLEGGLKSKTVLSSVLNSLFDKDEAEIKIYEGEPEMVYEAPADFVEESPNFDTDNQHGIVYYPLAYPIKVMVTDSEGEPMSDVPVYFDALPQIPEYSPNPSPPETDAVVDPEKAFADKGMAQSNWTMGSNEGTYYCDVYTRDAKGNRIGQHMFNATAEGAPYDPDSPIISDFDIEPSPNLLPGDVNVTYSPEVTLTLKGEDDEAIVSYLINYKRGSFINYPTIEDPNWVNISPVTILDISINTTLIYDSLNYGQYWRIACFIKDAYGNISVPMTASIDYKYKTNVSLTEEYQDIFPPQSLDDFILSVYGSFHPDSPRNTHLYTS